MVNLSVINAWEKVSMQKTMNSLIRPIYKK